MKILATDGFSEVGINLLEKAGHEVIIKNIAPNQLVNYINTNSIDGLLVKQSTLLPKEIISELTTLKFIGNCDRTSTHIASEVARKNNIEVFHAEHAWSTSVAEFTIAHMLSCMRHLKDSNREMPLEGDQNFNALKRSFSGGSELKGKTVGLIGFGRVGQEVAKKAIALGMRVKFYDKNIETSALELKFFDEQSIKFELSSSTLDEVLSTSDVISLHIPETDSYFIGAKELQKMKSTAGIINTSHGKCLDEVALVKSLENNKLGFGALDVFEDEPQPPIQLLMNPKLSLSPHIGGATQETQDRVSRELADQIISFSN
ncbi:NAD(P)-dependent oxidoreductase [Psychroflexus montanilacus]|uniref:NAD(P)-dependent oxidoreductase n=1 Tax=Psychroflexus montanilacus TaxID=2873598 RepID=UPI001CCE53A7|nr:NAD(P)-dependent oxidoreductase [Psychroflexus montanilacus]MBZ9650521.1 3-phosphoglycerate dehydrogenase [Psychroflexus montanilacus]